MMKKRLVPTMFTLAVGAAFGIALVLSCSDGSPHKVDAATCDCPASEPPLTGRFVTVSSGPSITIASGAIDGVGVTCPVGSQLISGSCTTPVLNPLPANLVLMESGFFEDPPSLPTGWNCYYLNNGPTPVTVTARALCLKPGP
jgi:hypothetical protein